MRLLYFGLSTLLLATWACDHKEHNYVTLGVKESEAIATINNQEIYSAQIDSMIDNQVIEIKMRTINYLISQNLLEQESCKKSVSKHELINEMVNAKARIVKSSDIENYINANNLTYIDTTKIREYLTNLNINSRQIEYIDSLKLVYDIEIRIFPTNSKKIPTLDLFSFYITENSKSKIDVYLISSFHCPACHRIQPKLQKIIIKYH
jgi:hypothetical protein